jgi:predicted ribosomally synthesized peptide with SipW-like signal peptide
MNTKGVLMGVLAIGLVAILLGVGTVAYFSDTETSSGNTFTAGTLDLAVKGPNDADFQNPNTSPDFQLGPLAPGQSGTITYTLKNVGSLDGYLDLSDITVTDAEGENPESETGGHCGHGELSNYMLSNYIWVTVTLGDQQLYSGKLKNIDHSYDADVPLPAGQTTTLRIQWVVDADGRAPYGADVPNDVQGDIVTVSFTIELDQVAD